VKKTIKTSHMTQCQGRQNFGVLRYAWLFGCHDETVAKNTAIGGEEWVAPEFVFELVLLHKIQQSIHNTTTYSW